MQLVPLILPIVGPDQRLMHSRAIRGLNKTPEDIQEFIIKTLSNSESIQTLRNWVFHEKQKVGTRLKFEWSLSEPSTFGSWAYLEKAQAGWERKMLRSLNSMCQELGIRLAGASQSSAAAQVYLQQGCPLGYRAQIWSLYLNAQKSDEDVQYYNQLKLRVAEDECMTDLLVCKEVQLTASNDDMHFVFCDYTYQVLLPFTRDSTVLEHFQSSLATPPRAIGKKATSSQIFPPSGVIPFHGFSMYVLPLCYLYDDPVTLYVIFRQLYIRYFYKLHTISNDLSVSLDWFSGPVMNSITGNTWTVFTF
ncbi:unnamed protein product [Echinostoma caproni]|uniref:TBC1 domain family member 19 n=1 Tax=Echinostoma caproni TaxID=27848 RepID=A0A182ZZA0_9TREM|nr:unnamed protein product [Echinostoma caproni]